MDLITRHYLAEPGRFAQVCNHALFGGAKIIQPELLRELDPSEKHLIELEDYSGLKETAPNSKNVEAQKRVFKAEDKNRDLIKEYNGHTLFLILGLESQQEVHYRMPLRHMLYDALRYNQQCNQLMRQHRKKRDWKDDREFLSGISNYDRLRPVITICVYWGEKSWSGPRNLHEMLDISPKIAQYKDRIGNYPLNLLEVRKIEDLETYDGELKGLLGFVKYQKDKDSLERFVDENKKMFRNLTAETVIAMSTLGNSRELQKHMLKMRDQSNTSGEEERIDMCQAIREMIEDGRMEGRMEGRKEGRKEGYDGINLLNHKLLDDNRLDDLRRSTVDPVYQQLLFREYGLLPMDEVPFA